MTITNDQLHDEIRDLDTRLNRHLEIYAQNGKAMQELSGNVSGLRNDVQNLCVSFDKYKESNKDALEWLKHLRWGKSALLALLGVVATTIGIAVGIMRLWK